MPLTASIITSAEDFVQIAPMDHDAWLTPYNPQLKHFRPIFPTREESIAFVIDRQTRRLNKHDPNHFMVKVTDTDTNEIIGYAGWAINDPATSTGEKTVATWHPEGSEEREFAECFIDGLWGFIAERVTGKHMGMWWSFLLLSLGFDVHRSPFSHSAHCASASRRRSAVDSLGNGKSG